MKTVLLCDSFLVIPQSRGWRVLECPSIAHLVAALGTAFPKKTEIALYVDHSDLAWREVTAPLAAPAAFRQVMGEEQAERGLSTPSAFVETPARQSDGTFRAILWYETQPFVLPLAELLATRNGQSLISAWPLGPALVEAPRDGELRASLAWLVLPTHGVLVGRDIAGRPFRARLPRNRGSALSDEARSALSRAGVAFATKAAMPARLRVIDLEDENAPTELESLERSIGFQNHLERRLLRADRTNREVLRTFSRNSLLAENRRSRIHQILPVMTMAAAALFAAVLAHGLWEIDQLRSSVEASRAALREEKTLLQRVDRVQAELASLEQLYGADAGWTEVVAKECIEKLDELLPREWSLDLVECEAKGRLIVKARWWGEGDRPSEASLRDLSDRIRVALRRRGQETAIYDQATRQLVFQGGES